jgi:hypothetical protein
MHSKSGNLQSVQIMPQPLIESHSVIGSIFSSSAGDPTFLESLFFVTDYSLSSLPEIGSTSSCNPHP